MGGWGPANTLGWGRRALPWLAEGQRMRHNPSHGHLCLLPVGWGMGRGCGWAPAAWRLGAPFSLPAGLQQGWDIAEYCRRRCPPCQRCACLAAMARPNSPTAPRDPRRASVVLSRCDSLCTLCQAGVATSTSSCHICATSGLEPPPLQGLGEVDRQHIPPLAVSRAVFSGDDNAVLLTEPRELRKPREPRDARTTVEPEACVTFMLQRTRLHVLAGPRELPIVLKDAEPEGDAFAPLVTAQSGGTAIDHGHAIDRSPMPPIETSWALYEGNDGDLG